MVFDLLDTSGSGSGEGLTVAVRCLCEVGLQDGETAVSYILRLRPEDIRSVLNGVSGLSSYQTY